MDHSHPTVKRIHIYILFIAVVLLLIVWILFHPQTNIITETPKESEKVPEVQAQPKGTLTVRSKTDQERFAVGQPFTLVIFADSSQEDIVAFDTILTFDQSAFTLNSTDAVMSSYQAIPTVQDEYVSVTAAQLPQTNTRSIFENTPVLEFTFTPKTQGNYTFILSSNQAKETAKFVNTKNETFYPKTSQISIEIY